MYSSGAPGPARRGGGNPPVNVPPPIRGAPQPSNMPGPMAGANAAAGRIGDMLDQVKAEYEAAVQQLNITKMEQIEVERKLQAQVVEMDQIQQTLKALEANHRRIRQQYEDDMMRMRRQLEGQQTTGVKMPAKRHRTPTNSGSGPSMGQEGDSLMSVVAAAAASSRAGSANPRSNSPVRVVPVQPASRSLQQLGQPPVPQGPPSQQGPPQLSQQSAPPQLSPLEGQSTTPTNRRNGPIPSLNSRDSDGSKKAESRINPPPSGSQSGQNSPVGKKAKISNEGNTIPSLSNGKGTLPSLNRDREREREHRGSGGESSPSSSTSAQSQQVSGSTPTGIANSSATKQSIQEANGPQGESNSAPTSIGSSNASKSSSSKGSKLNWNCVYNNTGSYADSERPVAELHQTMDHQSVVCCVRFSPDGTMMATGCHKTARVFDVKSGDRKFIVSRPGGTGANGAASSEEDAAYVRAVAFSPDCTKLVAGMPHNTIRVWDIATNEEGPAMTGHESEIYALDYVNDMIVSGSGDRKVRLWDARTGQCKKIFGSESGGPSDGVTSVALSPDGRYLAAGSLDKVVRIWDTESSQLLDRFEGHSDSVYSIAFSPDGKNVISGSLDRNIMLWDVNAQGRTSSRPRMVYQGHKDFVLSVAYTPDGRWLMSGSKDRSVVFWDPRSSRSVLTLTGYRNSVISVAASPSSPYFATGSGDCLAVVWKYQSKSF